MNKTVDIIRQNNKDYANLNSPKGLIAQLIASSAEDCYEFHIPFGSIVDKQTTRDMEGTYWVRVPQSDNTKYSKDIEIAII